MKSKQNADAGAELAPANVRRGWIYYKWTNERGDTYEKNIAVQHGRLAGLVVSDPLAALKILRAEMPNLKMLHVFACGEGEAPKDQAHARPNNP